MGDIEFNREAVGVSAKKDWADANEFARIGSFMASLTTFSASVDLPEGDNSGVTSLRSCLGEFREVMRWAVLEHSDACGVLGSGQEEVISNFDAAEYQVTETSVTSCREWKDEPCQAKIKCHCRRTFELMLSNWLLILRRSVRR